MRSGPHRTRFILDSVEDLRRSLRRAGSELLVRVGAPHQVLPRVAKQLGAAAVYCHGEGSLHESQVRNLELKRMLSPKCFVMQILAFTLECECNGGDIVPSITSCRQRSSHCSRSCILETCSCKVSWLKPYLQVVSKTFGWQVELDVKEALQKIGVDLNVFWSGTLFQVENLPFATKDTPLNYGEDQDFIC